MYSKENCHAFRDFITEELWILSSLLPKKSHTCEEGGTHLRISFWYLLMNL